jgi:hypothetical protein
VRRDWHRFDGAMKLNDGVPRFRETHFNPGVNIAAVRLARLGIGPVGETRTTPLLHTAAKWDTNGRRR